MGPYIHIQNAHLDEGGGEKEKGEGGRGREDEEVVNLSAFN